MYSNVDIEQQITVILARDKQPMMHTGTICRKLRLGAANTHSKEYRRVLRVLHSMEKRDLVYWWHEPRVGSTWMLKMRDICFALPVSGETICMGDLPF